jgi:hypothetical protein
MTYMTGNITCVLPTTLNPILVNPTVGYTLTCSASIPDYSITTGDFRTTLLCPSATATVLPNDLTITFDNMPDRVLAASSVATSKVSSRLNATTVTSTSTTTKTSVSIAGFLSTFTKWIAVSKWTRTMIIHGTSTTLRVYTNFFTACSSGPSFRSTASPPAPLANECPKDADKIVNTPAGAYKIWCGFERKTDHSVAHHTDNGMVGCINLCGITEGCTWASYYPEFDRCYLRFGYGVADENRRVWSGQLVGRPVLHRALTTTPALTAIPAHSTLTKSLAPSPRLFLSIPVSSGSSIHSNLTESPFPSPRQTPFMPLSLTSSVNTKSLNSLDPYPYPHAHPQPDQQTDTPIDTNLVCPRDDRTPLTAQNKHFRVVCGYDQNGVTTGPFFDDHFLGCVYRCISAKACVFASYLRTESKCYLKFGDGEDYRPSPDVMGAILQFNSADLHPNVSSTTFLLPATSSSLASPSRTLASPKSASSTPSLSPGVQPTAETGLSRLQAPSVKSQTATVYVTETILTTMYV